MGESAAASHARGPASPCHRHRRARPRGLACARRFPGAARETPRSMDLADRIDSSHAALLAANRLDLASAAKSAGLAAAQVDRLTLTPGAPRAPCRVRAPGRGAARPARGGAGGVDPPERAHAAQGPRADRRHRRHLRGAAERHGRLRRPLPEERQRLDPARRQGDLRDQQGARRPDRAVAGRRRACRPTRCSSSRRPTGPRWRPSSGSTPTSTASSRAAARG